MFEPNVFMYFFESQRPLVLFFFCFPFLSESPVKIRSAITGNDYSALQNQHADLNKLSQPVAPEIHSGCLKTALTIITPATVILITVGEGRDGGEGVHALG